MTEPLYRLFEAVDRQGPGSAEDTARAWSSLSPPPAPAIVDMGSGTGAATKALASVSKGSITALDQHPPFLERLEQWARQKSLSDRIRTVVGDIADPPFEDATFDVVWAEGSAYAIGFEAALRAWRRLLKDRGHAAITELVWRSSGPPAPALDFYQREYPDMATAADRRAVAARCGYRLLDDFMVSSEGWWDSYYSPLLAEISRMESTAPDDEAVAEVAAAVRSEVAVYRSYGDSFGYLFLILRKD